MGRALIHGGRIKEPIRDHDLSQGQRGANDIADVRGASCAEQEHLRLRTEGDLLRMKDDVAHTLSERGPTGLTGQDHVVPIAPE